MKRVTVGALTIANNLPFTLIAGPCQIELREHAMEVAGALAEMAQKLGIGVIYKSSYDKANRTSANAARGVGMAQGLEILAEVRQRFGLPVLTDVHDAGQCAPVAAAVDVLQIPAFLCRQTDLLLAAGQNRPGHQREKRPVSGPLGHEECRRENRQHGQREHPALRARRQLRLQHAGERHALAADHGRNLLSGGVRRHAFGAAAGRPGHLAAAASGVSRRSWRAPLWRWAAPPCSSNATRIRTQHPPTGRT